VPDVTLAGESPCQLCPGETHPFVYDRAGSYIIQCPKLAAERDQEQIVTLLPVVGIGFVALTAAGRVYRATFQNDQALTLTPIVVKWAQRAIPVAHAG
jgi:hypothetical protein